MLLNDRAEKKFAGSRLQEIGESFSFAETYDIFLSHSYDDARIIKQIYDMLTDKGHMVYVDWIEDENLDRGSVTRYTADIIRNRMNSCRSLIYVTSPAAETSVWMPWELGYMDAKTGNVSVAPILGEEDEDFEGREYLGLYPYLDLTSGNFYIHSTDSQWVTFKSWLRGQRPST